MKKLLSFISLAILLSGVQTAEACKPLKQGVWVDSKATFYRAYSSNSKTASGTTPTNFTLSVDPKVIPLGSLVQIKYPDGKTELRRAEDTGGKIKGTRVDVFYNLPQKKLLQLGVKQVKLRVIKINRKLAFKNRKHT